MTTTDSDEDTLVPVVAEMSVAANRSENPTVITAKWPSMRTERNNRNPKRWYEEAFACPKANNRAELGLVTSASLYDTSSCTWQA